MENVQVIILAGGKGTRMKSEHPKALAELKGKAFLKHILDNLAPLNLPIEPVIVVGYGKDKIKEVLGENHTYAEQKEPLGTGHAVMSAKDAAHKDHKIVFVLYVDQPMVSTNTIKKMLEIQSEKKPAITMATLLLPDFEDWRAGMNYFGRVVRNANGNIEKSVEYKDATEEQREIKELNPSIYAFDGEWLWENIDKIKNENAQGEYYLPDLIKMAIDQKRKIETVQIENLIEGIQPNSKEELEMLEKLA